MNIVIILAGGVGTRVGAEIPKQYIKIMGKPIMVYTLEKFENPLQNKFCRGLQTVEKP